MTSKALARFHTITMKELYDLDGAMQINRMPLAFYYVQEPRPGHTDMKLVKEIALLPDGSYRLTADVGDKQFIVSAEQVLYYPPEG